jgi:hypothetical protein
MVIVMVVPHTQALILYVAPAIFCVLGLALHLRLTTTRATEMQAINCGKGRIKCDYVRTRNFMDPAGRMAAEAAGGEWPSLHNWES